jgi:hypothetical protein
VKAIRYPAGVLREPGYFGERLRVFGIITPRAVLIPLPGRA